MNNKELNIALGKLFNGIELDTHKVELSYTLKQLQNFKDDLQDRTQSIIRFGKKLQDAQDVLDENISDGNKSFRNLEAAIKEIAPIMKDLGLPNAKELQGADKILSEYKQAVKKYQ